MLRFGSFSRIAMVWQPMPPPAIWPSSSSVERLCGQPEQKAAGREPIDFGADITVPGVATCRAARLQHFAQDLGDLVGIELAVGGKVRLAQDRRMPRQIIEDLAKLHLEEAALFFHHQHGFQAAREILHELGLEREGHSHFSDADTVVHAQVAQRLHQVVIRFAGAEDANARLGAVMPVHAVQSRELARGFQTPVVDLVLQRQRDRRNQPRDRCTSDNLPASG